MDVKLVLLMNCVALVCCQNTISIRNAAEWQNEHFEDIRYQVESIRQLLMIQQKADVYNDRQTIQEMKSEIEDIRQIMLKQHGNETQAMQKMKSEIEDIRKIVLNDSHAMQEVRLEIEEIRHIVIQQQYWSRNQQRKTECPFGFDYLPEADSCFTLILERMTWDSATERCRGIMPGVYLAAITSQEENNAITGYLQSQFSKNNIGPAQLRSGDGWGYSAWTSGQRRNPGQCNDIFVWKILKGLEIPINYTNWIAGEPSCYQNESCVHIAPSKDHHWNDYECNNLNFPLCEI